MSEVVETSSVAQKPSPTIDCDNCKGTGKADYHQYIGFAEHKISKVTCPRCKGTGKTEKVQ